MSNTILTEKIGKSMILRFNRPEIRNPLSVAVIENINEILTAAASEWDVERVIFTGTGGIFASGADLREIAALDPERAREFALRGQALMDRIAGSSKKIVAAVNGACFGGALDLALACHRRIVTPHATFCHPGAGLGIITGWGGTQRLPRLVGRANALEMFFTASPIDATRALGIGLVDAIADDPVAAALK